MVAFVGGRLQILQSLQGFQRGWIKATVKRNGMWGDLRRGMKKPLVPCGAEVGEMN